MAQEPRLADAVGTDEEGCRHILLGETSGVVDGRGGRIDRDRRTRVGERTEGPVEVLADARLEQRGGLDGLEPGNVLFDDRLDVAGHRGEPLSHGARHRLDQCTNTRIASLHGAHGTRGPLARRQACRHQLAELGLGDLADGVLRQGVEDDHVAGHLEPGERRRAQLDQLLRRHRSGVAKRDERHRFLAEDGVRASDDCGFQDRRMGVEDVLDLLRVDVLTTADDHVLDPVDEDEVAVGVEVADVAGVQPAILEGAGRLFGLVEVAAHDVGAADDHLALPFGRGPPVDVEQGDLLAGQREPHGAGLARPVDRVDGRRAGALGEAVPLDDRRAVALLEPGDEIGGHRSCAADGKAHRRGVRVDVVGERARAWRRSPARRRSTSGGPLRWCRRTSRVRSDP